MGRRIPIGTQRAVDEEFKKLLKTDMSKKDDL